jgi:hypothetical protein
MKRDHEKGTSQRVADKTLDPLQEICIIDCNEPESVGLDLGHPVIPAMKHLTIFDGCLRCPEFLQA